VLRQWVMTASNRSPLQVGRRQWLKVQTLGNAERPSGKHADRHRARHVARQIAARGRVCAGAARPGVPERLSPPNYDTAYLAHRVYVLCAANQMGGASCRPATRLFTVLIVLSGIGSTVLVAVSLLSF